MKISPAVKKKVIPAAVSAAVALASVVAMKFEGKVNHTYKDMGGTYTICYGHTQGVKAGQMASDAECLKYLQTDMAEADVQVQQATGGMVLPVKVRAAFDDFVFNEGIGNFNRSISIGLLLKGDIHGACMALMNFTRVGDNPMVPGLIRRRQQEIDTCLEGLK